MSVTNKAEFGATMDLRQVDQALATTEKRLLTLDGGSTRLSRSLGSVEEAGKRVQQRMSPAAAAIQGLGSAMGDGASMGGKLVAVGGQLGAAFGQGGVYAAAITAAVFVTSKLYGAYQEAAAGARVFGDATRATTEYLRTTATKGLDDYIKTVEDMERAVRDFGKTQGEVFIEGLERDIESMRLSKMTLEEKLIGMRTEARAATEMAAALRGSKYQEEAERLNAILAQTEARLGAVTQRLPAVQAALERAYESDVALDRRKASAKDAAKSGRRASTAIEVLSGSDRTDSDSLDAQLATIEERNLRREALLAASADREYTAAIDARRRADEILAGYDYAEVERKQQALDQVRASYASLYMDALPGMLGNATGALNQFFVGVASGQKHAAELAAASFLSSTGSQLVGLGTKAIWEGAIISANPLTPGAGLPMIGIGLGAVAAGIGMGAGGAALAASIPSGGGGARGAETRGSSFDGGGGGPGAVGGGGLTINISYAAAGPAPEQTGRAITEAIATLDRRRGLPPQRRGPRR